MAPLIPCGDPDRPLGELGWEENLYCNLVYWIPRLQKELCFEMHINK